MDSILIIHEIPNFQQLSLKFFHKRWINLGTYLQNNINV
jgi:hypothetical protein